MGTIRSNKNPGVIIQEEHSDSARALRGTECGFTIGNNVKTGTIGIHPDITTAVFVGKNRHLYVMNRNVAIQYIAIGDASVGAPTGTNGVPIMTSIGQPLVICTGENEYIRGSHADIHVTEIED